MTVSFEIPSLIAMVLSFLLGIYVTMIARLIKKLFILDERERKLKSRGIE